MKSHQRRMVNALEHDPNFVARKFAVQGGPRALEALLEERGFRAEAVWLAEPPLADLASEEDADGGRFDRPHLLDEPFPPMDDEDAEPTDAFDPRWEDLAQDPAWDREPRWSGGPPASPRPGLARTQAMQVELPLSLDLPPKKRTQSA